MTRNSELTRLKSASEAAFTRKQKTWHRQDESWQHLKSLKSKNGPQIDTLTRDHNIMYVSMQDAYTKASKAYEAKNYNDACMYSDQGKHYQAQMSLLVEERRHLVTEIRSACDDHIRTRDEFRSAKNDYDSINREYQTKLDSIKTKRHKGCDEIDNLASRIGVPSQYIDNAYVGKNSDGSLNIVLGGIDKPGDCSHGRFGRRLKKLRKKIPIDLFDYQDFEDDQFYQEIMQSMYHNHYNSSNSPSYNVRNRSLAY